MSGQGEPEKPARRSYYDDLVEAANPPAAAAAAASGSASPVRLLRPSSSSSPTLLRYSVFAVGKIFFLSNRLTLTMKALLGDRTKWGFLAVVLVTCCSLTTSAAVLDDDDESYNWSYRPPPRPGRSAVVHRALGAVASMMELYDDATGRWQATEPWWLPDNSPWWQSGNALQALLDFVYRVTGGIDDEYYYYYVENAMNTIRIQREPLPWWVQGGGEFRASSTDDTGWWALALCRLYDLTGNTTYLEIAEIGAEYMRSYWDDVCGGGIWWDVDPLRYKTAISNTLLMKVQVSLHNRIPNDQMYLELALETWNWFNQSGMINEEYLINDRLNDITCENNNDTTWTYNQGVVLGALAELYLATGNMEYIFAARSIADAVVASPDLSPNGILTEPCEGAGTCNLDQASFKGIFTRNLAELNDLLDDSPYESYLRTQAVSLYVNGRNATDFYGLSWKGPFINSTFSISTQVSAVSLLTAVIDKSNSSSTVPPSSTITLSPPTLRYTPWSLLDDSTRNTATTVLGYNETLWNYPGTAAVETMEWNALTVPQQNAAAALNLDKDTWNCYQNHYTGFDWTQLATNNVQVYWAILGWTAAIWESDNLEVQPAALFKAWNALTPLEQAAAQDLCFYNYTWGNAAVPLTEWPARQDASEVNNTLMPSVAPVTDENGIAGGTNSSNATPTILVPTTSPSLVPETPGPTLEPSKIEPPSAMEPSMGSANDTLNPTDARNDGSFEPTVLPTDLPTTLFTSGSNDLFWAGIVYKVAAVLFIGLVCMLDG